MNNLLLLIPIAAVNFREDFNEIEVEIISCNFETITLLLATRQPPSSLQSCFPTIWRHNCITRMYLRDDSWLSIFNENINVSVNPCEWIMKPKITRKLPFYRERHSLRYSLTRELHAIWVQPRWNGLLVITLIWTACDLAFAAFNLAERGRTHQPPTMGFSTTGN